MDRIDSFKEEYRFLSNFYQTPVTYGGLTYPNAEAAFQAQKCRNEEDKVKYTQVKNPVRAKQMGKKEPGLPENWREISYDIMLEIERAKFSTPEIAGKLLSTGDEELVEGNNHHDNLWGDCSCARCAAKVGENRLGKILMQVREELKNR